MTYAIRLTFTAQLPPVIGWVLDGTKVARFETADDAERAKNRLRRDQRYTWNNVRLEVAEYGGKR